MNKKTILLSLALCWQSQAATAGEVEVLHYWTSGGEAAAIDVLKDLVKKRGHTWRDFVVPGGGGESANAELKKRVIQGEPPASAMVKGPDIERWARLGFLQNLDELAKKQHWDEKLPPVIADVAKFRGHYVSTPVNVHRVNWMWINKRILDDVGVAVPTTWEEFEAAAKKIQAKGYPVIAHGDQSWQDATVFESVALAVGGEEFYRLAFVENDYGVIKSDTMTKVLAQFRRLQPYFKTDLKSQDWNVATQAVINGQAAFQFMGDWAKGEFEKAGQKAGKDFVCAPMPGTSNQFLYNIDTLVMFQLKSADAQAAQQDLADAIMSETFQNVFNLKKGSIPARMDVSLDQFDDCARLSRADFLAAEKSGGLLPSIAHGMATTARVQEEFYAVLHEFLHDPGMSPEKATVTLAKRMRYGSYAIN
ncbi:ABC transporter substrate-binding protein [Hahella sp. HN01]|uniref:ABC transporter substrate-binding protein n=1 Tax=Hahella sp. HN01 TaxID=2847262 RepID=UPI001C1F0080|nr:ABC transporter substrate-binding protein [Hahella sp. HN01]MBU6950412.1 ABC transporter substrate-binding protein [Hahella sp. HN01]